MTVRADNDKTYFMKYLQLVLDDELHRRLKVACAQQGTGMSEVVRKLIVEYVERTEKKLKK